ncbi:MAG: zinc-binding protein [Methanobacteriales archaeon Met13]
MTPKKIALAACSGMSPHGLVSRVATDDTVTESDNLISICMGATSADQEGFRGLIKKYPIVAINGCDAECVNKILAPRCVRPHATINVQEVLKEENLKANDVSRLDEVGELCVGAVKKKIKQVLD